MKKNSKVAYTPKEKGFLGYRKGSSYETIALFAQAAGEKGVTIIEAVAHLAKMRFGPKKIMKGKDRAKIDIEQVVFSPIKADADKHGHCFCGNCLGNLSAHGTKYWMELKQDGEETRYILHVCTEAEGKARQRLASIRQGQMKIRAKKVAKVAPVVAKPKVAKPAKVVAQETAAAAAPEAAPAEAAPAPAAPVAEAAPAVNG